MSSLPTENLSTLIWTCFIYLLLACFAQLIFFSNRCIKFFGRHQEAMKLFRGPITFSIWVVALFYIIENTLHAFNYSDIDEFLVSLKTCLLIASFAFGVRAYKSHFLKLYVKKNPLSLDANVINGIDKILSVSIVIIASLLILDALNFKSGPLLAFGGVGAAALGFAAKDVISNFFGGFMLVISRPFDLGDLILVPDRSIEAHVIHVGWYMTTLKDKSKRFIYLPNSIFVSAYIVNSTRRTHRQVNTILSLENTDKAQAQKALQLVRKELASYPGLDQALRPYICLESCDFDVFNIKVMAYTEIREEKEFFEYQEKLLLHLCELFKASGLKFQSSHFVLNGVDSKG